MRVYLAGQDRKWKLDALKEANYLVFMNSISDSSITLSLEMLQIIDSESHGASTTSLTPPKVPDENLSGSRR